MTKDKFVRVASYIFLLVGIFHIVRLVYGWEVQIGNFMVPMWIYWIEAVVLLYLSYLGFQSSKQI